MAKYSDIKGFTVQTLSTDTVASQFVGGAWASGGALNTARSGLTSNAVGTQTAGMASGGSVSPRQQNEQYNGSSWTEVGDLTSGHSFAGAFGTSTASILAGGEISSVLDTVEVWDGSSWTETTEINTARSSMGSYGSAYTAGAVVGGYSTTNTSLNENWNGSAWTELNDLNTARHGLGAGGTTTSAIAGGGQDAPNGVNAETWNGSTWTAVSNINVGRTRWAMTATDSTSAIGFAGRDASPAYVGTTEVWDGSSWTEVADMATGRNGLAGSGTSAAALASGGYTGTVSALTEEFTAPVIFNKQVEGQLFFNSTANAFKETIQDIASGTWGSGGTMNTARTNINGMFAGNKTAGLIFGGREAPPAKVAYTESYDGSSWTEVNDLNTARHYAGGAGTNTAALCIGNSASPQNVVESWNGSSWTEIAEINTGRGYWTCAGTSTDAIAANGYTNTMVNSNELWDGTSWTESGNTNSTADSRTSAGNTSAALQAGGYITTTPPTNTVNTEIWNGSSWTEVNNLNQAERAAQGGGSSTQALACGGSADIPPFPSGLQTPVSSTEYWNGTSWTELNDLSTTRTEHGGRGNALNNMVAGGQVTNAASYTGTSEEWTAGLTNKTITAT